MLADRDERFRLLSVQSFCFRAKLDLTDDNDHSVLDSAVCGNAQLEMIA